MKSYCRLARKGQNLTFVLYYVHGFQQGVLEFIKSGLQHFVLKG